MTVATAKSTSATKERLHALLARMGQEHLLAFWDRLTSAEREQLGRQIEGIDPAVLGALQEQCKSAAKAGPDEGLLWAALAAKAQPPRAVRLDGSGVSFSKEDARRRGTRLQPVLSPGVLELRGGQRGVRTFRDFRPVGKGTAYQRTLRHRPLAVP